MGQNGTDKMAAIFGIDYNSSIQFFFNNKKSKINYKHTEET